jgi:hypothetical protein
LEDGSIRVDNYHSHDCKICPANLCKQIAIKEYLRESNQIEKVMRIIYVGDGGNDYCPLLMLKPEDMVFVRKDFRLEQKIKKNPSAILC